MKLQYYFLILLGVYALNSNAALRLHELDQYLFRSQAKLEEFTSYSTRGLGTLAQSSLKESIKYIDALKQAKSQLRPEQLALLEKLDLEVKAKMKIETETIGTCDYRNIEHFREIDQLNSIKARGDILTFNTYKRLYLLKINEVKGCKQYNTWLSNFNEISV